MKTAELTEALLDYWVAKAEEAAGLLTFDLEAGDMPNESGTPKYISVVCGVPHIWGSGKIHPGTHDMKTGKDWVLHGPGGKYSPSSDWAHGGPIIERDLIEISGIEPGRWIATPHLPPIPDSDGGHVHLSFTGPTPLVAAMRAYVASKYGDEVADLP